MRLQGRLNVHSVYTMYIDFGIEFNVTECLGLSDYDLARLVEFRLQVVSRDAKWRLVDAIKDHILGLETEKLLPMGAREVIN